MISILIHAKRRNSVNIYMKLQLLFYAHRLIIFEICIKFSDIVFNGFLRLFGGHDFNSDNYKGA